MQEPTPTPFPPATTSTPAPPDPDDCETAVYNPTAPLPALPGTPIENRKTAWEASTQLFVHGLLSAALCLLDPRN